MGTPFENFVNTELPRRPALLTQWLTSYDGDPNDGMAPLVIQNSPIGTFYLQTTGSVLWQRKTSSATSWEVVGGGSSAATTLVSATVYVCPPTVVVGDLVYLDSADEVGLASADSPDTMPTLGAVHSKTDATHCLVQYNGDLGGFSGLTVDATYYVSDSDPGKITDVPPSAAGSVLQVVGKARNTTTLILSVDFMDYILL